MTAPEPKSPDGTPPVQPLTNAPAFTDQAAAREITRLNGLLTTSNAENTRLNARVQELEGEVDAAKQKELEDRAAAAEAERDRLKGEAEQRAAADQRTTQAAALKDKVRDPEAALRLLTDDLKDKDGNPDVSKIIAKYPYLAPDGAPPTTAPNPGGGPQTPAATTLDAAVASKNPAAINAAFDAELKGENK